MMSLTARSFLDLVTALVKDATTYTDDHMELHPLGSLSY